MAALSRGQQQRLRERRRQRKVAAAGLLLAVGIAVLALIWPRQGSPRLQPELVSQDAEGRESRGNALPSAAAEAPSSPSQAAGAVDKPGDPLRFPVGNPRRLEAQHGYVSSEACIQCHTEEHQSWHASFHRTMTQVPTANAVRAPFKNVALTDPRGWKYQLEQQGDEFWIDMVDLDWYHEQLANQQPVKNPPRKRQQVVMVTGSHHKQAFWVPSAKGKYMLRVPWSYRIDDGRWIPIEYDFLAPPGTKAGGDVWDFVCIRCHSVGGQPRANSETSYDSHVAELGISCESCHGPGASHVAYRQALQNQQAVPANDPIYNPGKGSHQLGSQVCGSCHSYSTPREPARYEQSGWDYRPGDDLHATRHVILKSKMNEPWLQEIVKRDAYALEGSFWGDGAIRVAGREYNGLLESPCHLKGELSCMSCHSQHNYQQPDDLLHKPQQGNATCVQCHQEYQGAGLANHTHHQADSTGSQCYNCHMPHTTYGLFKAVRAHKIDSPSVANQVATGRPNACNLCHLDRSLQWTADKLTQWYAAPAVKLEAEQQNTAASLLWLLRGDAAQRAVTAWHMGWEPAQRASGTGWMAPHLSMAFLDPYPAVRNVAGRSMRKLPGFTELPYDFLAPVDRQRGFLKQVAQAWLLRRSPTQRFPSTLLYTPTGIPDAGRVTQLIKQRDGRLVFIDE